MLVRQGYPFDREVAGELWDQARLNQYNECEIEEMVLIIHEAQNILANKLFETTQKLDQLQLRRRQLQTDPRLNIAQRAYELSKLDKEIEDKVKDKTEFSEDLAFLVNPFLPPSAKKSSTILDMQLRNSVMPPQYNPNNLFTSAARNTSLGGSPPVTLPILQSKPSLPLTNLANSINYSDLGKRQSLQQPPQLLPQPLNMPLAFPNQNMPSTTSYPLTNFVAQPNYQSQIPQFSQAVSSKTAQQISDLATKSRELAMLFWIVALIGLLELVIINKKSDFLNLLIVLTTMSIFMLNYLNREFISVCVVLVSLSMATDFVWLYLFTPIYWNPPSEGEFSSNTNDFLKFVVVLSAIIFFAKFPLLVLLCKYKQQDIPRGLDINILHFQLKGTRDNFDNRIPFTDQLY